MKNGSEISRRNLIIHWILLKDHFIVIDDHIKS